MTRYRTKLVILPKLHDFGGDLSKQWFVFYSYRNPKTSRMVRFKTSQGLCNIEKRLRYRNAEKLITELSNKLNNGWNPFVDEQDVIYDDQLKYHHVAEKHFKAKGKNRTFRLIMSNWLKERKPVIAQSTYQTYQSKFRIFLDWLKVTGRDQNDASTFLEADAKLFINHLFEKRQIGQTMVRQYIIILGQIFKMLVKKETIARNPFEEIKIRKVDKIPARYFNDTVLTRIKNEMKLKDTQLWMAVQFQYYCFIRPKELRFMRVSDLDLQGNSLTVRREVSKTNKTRVVVIPEQFKDYLESLKIDTYPKNYYLLSLEGTPGIKPVGKNYLWNHWTKIRTALNLSTDYKLYSFKHTGAVRLSKSASVKDIQMQLGHHSLDQVDQYLRQMKAIDSVDLRERFPGI
ncbi:MAG: tyrosine-type recombinase/integrase [Bacteroidales bacterium]